MRLGFIPLATRTWRSVPSQNSILLSRFSQALPASAKSLRPRMQSTTGGTPDLGEDTVMKTVHQKISDALNPTRLQVVPTYDDPNGSHVSITVVSDAFQGLNIVKRHQAVYKVIWEELQVC